MDQSITHISIELLESTQVRVLNDIQFRYFIAYLATKKPTSPQKLHDIVRGKTTQLSSNEQEHINIAVAAANQLLLKTCLENPLYKFIPAWVKENSQLLVLVKEYLDIRNKSLKNKVENTPRAMSYLFNRIHKNKATDQEFSNEERIDAVEAAINGRYKSFYPKAQFLKQRLQQDTVVIS